MVARIRCSIDLGHVGESDAPVLEDTFDIAYGGQGGVGKRTIHARPEALSRLQFR